MSMPTSQSPQGTQAAATAVAMRGGSAEPWHDKPTFICGHRKSGTTMLLCQFDAHPQLCVFPPDSGFFYAYYPIFDAGQYSDQEKKQRIVDVLYRNFKDELEGLGDGRQVSFSAEAMEQRFFERMEGKSCTPQTLLKEAVLAFHGIAGCQGETSPQRWMEKTTSTEIYAADIFRWYPQAKCVHLIRDPRDNYGSLKSGWDARYKDQNDEVRRLLQSAVDRGGLGLRLAKLNQERFGLERYRVVRFEDLTAEPEKVMRQLANFLEIEYDDCLLRPTFCGLPWRGNNFQGLKFDKPSPVNVDRWRQRIDEHEAKVIEFYCGADMKEWGYETAFPCQEQSDAATEHYKWYNFAQRYSVMAGTDTVAPANS